MPELEVKREVFNAVYGQETRGSGSEAHILYASSPIVVPAQVRGALNAEAG